MSIIKVFAKQGGGQCSGMPNMSDYVLFIMIKTEKRPISKVPMAWLV